MRLQLIVAAAGLGVRLGKGPKALVPLAGKPLIVWTLERLAPLGLLDNAVILHPPGFHFAELFQGTLSSAFPHVVFQYCEGGAERQISVRNALDRLSPETEIVVIHDAARPFVPLDSVRAAVDAAFHLGGATVAMPVTDTILCSDSHQFLAETPDRSRLWACQTPQVFRVDAIKHAHRQAVEDNAVVTDDATLARKYGCQVKLVPGSPLNIKITTSEDLDLAECIVEEELI